MNETNANAVKRILTSVQAAVYGHECEGQNGETYEAVIQLTPTFIVGRDSIPINEFENNNTLFMASFPFLFLHSRGVPGNSSLSDNFVQFLLHHYSNRFSQNHRFLFTLFNQLQRHQACKQVSTLVKSNHASIEQFKSIALQPEFKETLRQHINKPNTREAKQFVESLLKCIHVAGSKVPYSPVQQSHHLSEMYAMVQFFGTPTWFLTLSPSDIDSPLTVRLCFKSNSTLDNEQVTEALNNYGQRAKLVAENPVHAAEVFFKMLEEVFSCLMQLKPDHTIRKSHSPVTSRTLGIFGIPVAYYGVIETQGRGSLHAHLCLWASIRPSLLNSIAHRKELVQRATKLLESIVTASLPSEVYQEGKRRRKEGVPAERFALKMCPTPKQDKAAFIARIHAIAEAVQTHFKHNIACHKGKTGKIHCRFRMPRGLFDETRPIQIFIQLEPPYYRVGECIDGAPQVTQDNLFLRNDPRVVVYELKRILAEDAYLVEFCPALTGVLGSNTTMSLICSAHQGQPIIHYILKYMVKDVLEIHNCLTCLYEAVNRIEHHPSIAEDSGTETRTAQHLLTRTINNVNKKGEVSGQFAAGCLLGKKSIVSSHGFVYCFAWGAINFVKNGERAQLQETKSDAEEKEKKQ